MGASILLQGIPVWLVALVLAVASPLLVRLYAAQLERRTARRTQRFVERLAQRTGVADDADDAETDGANGDDEVKGRPRLSRKT